MSTAAPRQRASTPRQRQAEPARLAELMPIEIQGVVGFYLTGDRARVTKGADKPATFIAPAPRVTAWGVADGEPWYFVHVGPHERIVTKGTLTDGTAWDGFPNVPAAGSRTGREVLHCLIRQLVQLDALAESTVATTTGWHDMPTGPVFVTGPAGVAIGAAGPVEMRTQLDQVPDRYGIDSVPDAATTEGLAALVDGWRESVALLDFGPLAVTGATLGSAYLAPIGNRLPDRATFMTWMRATTQSGKSTFIAYVLSHFGRFTADTLPFGYMDSVPATEQGLHVVRDLWAPLDDYRRTGIAGTDAAMDKLADFAIRAVGNGAGRKLLTRDRKRAAPRNPQAGGYLTTAEVSLPAQWESAEGRVYAVELGRIGTPGGLRMGTERPEAAAERGAYRAAMAGYLRWLAADLDGQTQRYGDARRAQRRRYAAEHPSLAGRTWDQLSCMWLGWRMWCDYGQAIGATTEAEAARTLGRVMAALIDQAQHSSATRAETDQGARGFALLRAVLGGGLAHTPDRHTGGVPVETPAAYGYRRTASAAGDGGAMAGGFNSGPLYIGGGPAIGRVDLAGRELILDPDLTYRALAGAAGGGLPIPAAELWERWAAAGHTVTGTESRGGRAITRSKTKRQVDGVRDWRVVVRLDSYTGGDAEALAEAERPTRPTGSSRWGGGSGGVSAGHDGVPHPAPPAPPENTVSGDHTGGACQVCRRPGAACGPIVAVAEVTEPCVCCGRPVLYRAPCGAAREYICPGPGAGVAPTTPAGPTAPPRPIHTAERPVPAAADTAELADWTRAVGKVLDTDAVAAELAAASLTEWHTATGGLRWLGWAGDTAVAALAWLDGKRGAGKRGESAAPLDCPELDAIAADALLHLDYVHPGQPPRTGQAVTQLDVNGQFLASAPITLGTGDPLHIDRPASLAGLTKSPGYVRLASDAQCAHPAFAGRLTAGAVLVMPTADYLTRRGVHLDPAEVVIWPAGHHRPHLAAWGRLFRGAYYALIARQGQPGAEVALKMVKHVYTVMLGGWLRSEKNHSRVMRRDWSDHIIAESWVRALAALEKAEVNGFTAAGMRRDSAWFLADTAPIEPAGLVTRGPDGGPTRQLGKWKLDRWAEVNTDIIDAHGSGSPDLLNKAIKAAHEAREAGQ